MAKWQVFETPCFPAKWKVGRFPEDNNATCYYFRTRRAAELEAQRRNLQEPQLPEDASESRGKFPKLSLTARIGIERILKDELKKFKKKAAEYPIDDKFKPMMEETIREIESVVKYLEEQ